MQSTNETMIKELSQVCQQWDKAIADNNLPEIGRYMADDWIIVGTEGGISPKSRFLDFIKSGDLLHSGMDFKDINIRVYENTGVVVSRGTSRGTYKGESFSYFEWSTNVFIKKDEQWLCVLTMLTPAEGKA
jgi:ketosteroid isomerase-like protein